MTRNWSEYNEKLVRRGEFYLSPDFLENWDEELEQMNEGKVGAPYKFPEIYVQFAALWYEFFDLPYRQLEGALKKLGEFLPELEASAYTSLWHRFKNLEFEIPESGDEVVAAVNATRVKLSNRGDWIRKYHEGKLRGWIKVHVADDVGSKELLSIEVTDERTADSEVFEDLVENLDLKNCLADGAYDAEKYSNSWRGRMSGLRE